MENSLKWTGQFAVTPPSRTQKLPGDKICLPPSALEQILSAARTSSFRTEDSHPPVSRPGLYGPYGIGREARYNHTDRQRELPYPLTFRLVNPENGRVVHSGIREFSANENEVSLSPLLLQSLGIEESDFESKDRPLNEGAAADMDNGDAIVPAESESSEAAQHDGYPKITVHAVQLAKGTYVRLRPLEAGYDVEDWKALLERHLRDNFTTLTAGEVLLVPVGRSQTFQFLVDKFLPEGDAICIVDTDLEVDIEALDEEQARETLKRRLAKISRAPDSAGQSSVGGEVVQGKEVSGQILRGEYVDYELQEWERQQILEFELDIEDDDEAATVDIFVSPFSPRQRARPRADEHVWGDFSNEFPKQIQINSTNIELNGADSIYISVHASHVDGTNVAPNGAQGQPLKFNLKVTSGSLASKPEESLDDHDMSSDEEEKCKNCHQWVPKRTMMLHENFCLRNNILCSKCKMVFQKRSSEWQNHWHCPKDDSHGNTQSSRSKHDAVFHSNHSCRDCQYDAPNLPELAHHRTTVCPEKLILCQFCHLVVPQKGESDPDILDPEVLLSNLTPHELVDGGRTTECHLCNKIVRLRDMNTHLRHHELDRLSRPPPRICINPNCSRTLDDPNKPRKTANTTNNDSLGLCNVCFGPLYVDIYDPEGKALRRRIERRYLSQMLSGCGKPWCRNEYCKTGRANVNLGDNTAGATTMTTKEILPLIKPFVDGVSIGPGKTNTCPLYYCTDENTQQRRKLAETLAAEGASASSSHGHTYDVGWCVAGIESAGGDVARARDWLRDWAPKKGETF